MIPKDKVEEVRLKADIVQVISEYLPLVKRGRNHVGLCPFHSEKTPSFSVSVDKQMYYCFGCHSSGNVVSFVMQKEGLAFPDAVRKLAARVGVRIEESAPGRKDASADAFAANRHACEYFVRELKGPAGAPAREYLRQRGYDPASKLVADMRIGYAPDKWDGAISYLKRAGIKPDDAVKAGVAVKGDKGLYDRFRARLVFPITDALGRVVGFGARALDPKAKPKYLNSPESAVFKKGSTLYGFYSAKDAILKQRSAIVVEGYFDLLALRRFGFANSVATMGTALTSEHLRAMRGYVDKVYTLFDADEAGRSAALRSLPLFLDEEISCRAVIILGKDPDEFLKANGAEELEKAIEGAMPLMEFYLRELLKKHDVASPEGKRRYLSEALGVVSKVSNVAEKGHWAAIVATHVGVPVSAIYDSLKATTGATSKEPQKLGMPVDARRTSARLAELTALKVMARHTELITPAVLSAAESFGDPAVREAATALARAVAQNKVLDAASLMEGLTQEAGAILAAVLMGDDDGFIEDPGRMLEDSLKSILNRGKLRKPVVEIIEALEREGHAKVAEQIRGRMGRGAPDKKR